MDTDIVLGRTASYAGGAAPTVTVTVTFSAPVPEYRVDEGGRVTRLLTADRRHTRISQGADRTTYRAALDVAVADGGSRYPGWRHHLDAASAGDVDALTVPLAIEYASADGQYLGRDDRELVILPVPFRRDTEVVWEPDLPGPYIAVDAATLASHRRRWAQEIPAIEGAPLLSALVELTTLGESGPVLFTAAVGTVRSRLAEQFGEESGHRLADLLVEAHPALVDVTLTVPELTPLVVAGDITVHAPGTVTVTGHDLSAFEVVAEWSGAHDATPHRVAHRFTPETPVAAGSATFTIDTGRAVYRSTVASPVRVSVRGLDGATLWRREYAADDTELATLRITVPLRPRGELTGPAAQPVDANLRLRGRVLVLGDVCSCTTADVLVLLEARTTADGDWRIVGAATADTAGNFGMAYPFGRFAEARAVVSLAPTEHTTVPVHAVRGERSIDDGFLYLLVRHPYRPNGGGEDDDCGCHDAGRPDRLPGFSDLVGSDAYSQDIGGSCVNLSTPNRTINEFPFSAVVRTSDPEIGTYRLVRHEVGLESTDVAQATVLRSAAATLRATTVAALELARRALAGSVNTGTQLVLDTMVTVDPHTIAIEAALVPGAPTLTATALGALETRATAVRSTLTAACERATREDLGFPTPVLAVTDAAVALGLLVREAIDAVGPATRYELVGETVARERRPIGLGDPLPWQPDATAEPALATGGDLAATFSQAVSVATGHLLHYTAQFKADGYSLGDLVYSLGLAPGQKKEIVVFDAAQDLTGTETQALSQGERLAAGLIDEREITSTLAGSIGEVLSGGSSARTSGYSVGGGIGAQVSGGTGVVSGSAGGVLGVSGGSSQSSSDAGQQGSRDVAQFFGEKLRQAIMQNAESYRQANAAVVTSVRQGQRYGVTSEVVANHNHCHSLTMMYFEVLRHYAIFQELSSVEECVFVPFLLTRFSTENVAGWRDVLAPALLPLPSETYFRPSGPSGEHPLVRAFDAVTRLRTNYANVDLPVDSFDEEPIRSLTGTLDLRVSLPRPRTRYDRITSLPVIRRRVTTDEIDPVATAKRGLGDAFLAGLTGGLSALLTNPGGTPNIEYKEADVLVKQAVFDAFMTMDATWESVPPAQCIRVTNFAPSSISLFGQTVSLGNVDFFDGDVVAERQWTAYAIALDYAKDAKDKAGVVKFLDVHFKGRLLAEWDDIFYRDIAPDVVEAVADELALTAFSIRATPQSRYTGGDQTVRVAITGTTSSTRRDLPASLDLTAPGFDGLRQDTAFDVRDLRLEYATAHYHGVLYSGGPGGDVLAGAQLAVPESPEERRSPRREDRYLAAALIEHLNAHLEHYNKVLWSRLDPDRRFMLLDGACIQIFDEDGAPVPEPAGLRSLASVVKNEVVAVAGNSMVFPVAPGYRVSGALVQRASGDESRGESRGESGTGTAATPSLLDHYRPLHPVEPFRVSVPTQGVFAEAVQGACNACERIEPDRVQDWSRFPSDEPTPISPVTLPTPAPQDWKPQYRDFAPPIVTVQNAPGAPGPGAGLAGLADLLGGSDAFRDLTGLDATQQNAIRTYLSNQENAKAFAEMAKELAMQNHNSRNSRTIMDGIAQAQRTEAIDKKEAGALVKDHLQQQIDGGAATRTRAESDRLATATPLTRTVVEAAGRGQEVEATREYGSGEREHVTVRGEGSVDGGEVTVPGTVPDLRQEKQRDCWAVAAAILRSWRERRTVTAEAAATAAGQDYRRRYLADTGLPASDKDDFLLRSEMVAEGPASYTPAQYATWLRTYGPLWITIDARPDRVFSPHARVLTRISGTGAAARMTFLDPRRGSQGGEITQTFEEFRRVYEQMVTDNDPRARLYTQVVHFAGPVEKTFGAGEATEGYQIESPLGINEPVHETITVASLLGAGVPVPRGVAPGTDLATDEFFRGVLWNDDPDLLLFDEDAHSNWVPRLGLSWYACFRLAKSASMNNVTNLTGRSHFFDLQFLHAMAESAGEEPGDTLSKILMWAEVTYRLAVLGGVAGTAKLADVAVTGHATVGGNEYTATLSDFFTDLSRPTGAQTLGHLLTRDTEFRALDLRRRAIGSLLHVVQDSYARGHVRRTLLNPEDLVDRDALTFRPGAYGRFGAVENFHCYRGQDEAAHDAFDQAPKDMRATELSSFDSLVGARDAIEAGRRLLTMWRDSTPWDAAGGPKAYLRDEVFALSPDATPADATV